MGFVLSVFRLFFGICEMIIINIECMLCCDVFIIVIVFYIYLFFFVLFMLFVVGFVFGCFFF